MTKIYLLFDWFDQKEVEGPVQRFLGTRVKPVNEYVWTEEEKKQYPGSNFYSTTAVQEEIEFAKGLFKGERKRRATVYYNHDASATYPFNKKCRYLVQVPVEVNI